LKQYVLAHYTPIVVMKRQDIHTLYSFKSLKEISYST